MSAIQYTFAYKMENILRDCFTEIQDLDEFRMAKCISMSFDSVSFNEHGRVCKWNIIETNNMLDLDDMYTVLTSDMCHVAMNHLDILMHTLTVTTEELERDTIGSQIRLIHDFMVRCRSGQLFKTFIDGYNCGYFEQIEY